MPYGTLSEAQIETIKPFVEGQVVHDLGAGDCVLACRLLDTMGAQKVVAIDSNKYMSPYRELPKGVEYRSMLFFHWAEPIDIAFVSWPQGNDCNLEDLVQDSRLVIYLGKNWGGVACGTMRFFKALRDREVLAMVPDERNTLIVHGPKRVTRKPTPEERAIIYDPHRVFSYEELYGSGVLKSA